MPRCCVICGRAQSHSFSVFSFPKSQKKLNAWVNVILKVKPDFLKDKSVVNRKKLKNGICELHFFRSEISNGKKRRLVSDAIPTLDIPTSERSSSTLRKYKTFLISEGEDYPLLLSKSHNTEAGETTSTQILAEASKPCREVSLPDCVIEIKDKSSRPIIYKSKIQNIFSNENRNEVCLCCGCKRNSKTLFSILKAKSSEGDHFSLVEELSAIFETSQEKLISSGCLICRKCLKIVEDILEFKYSLSSLIAYIKNIFRANNNNNNNEKESVPSASYIERLEKELSPFSCNEGVRKSSRILPHVKRFSCSECSKEFSSLSSLSIHTLTHDDDDDDNTHLKDRKSNFMPYCCQFCKQSFLTKSRLSLHLESHSGTFNCEYCGRLITSKSRLNAHVKKFHGIGDEKERSFHCKSCAKAFSSKGGLRYHELSLHNKGKSLTCEICFKVFTYPMLYKNHKLFVHGDKNILCEICGEMFFTKSKLNIHVNAVHIKALSWSCNICNEKFTTSAFYKHHVSVKHKRIIYSCSQCTAQFRKKNTLVQHMWKHGNFMCPKCNVKYNDSSSFVSHMLEIHNLDISKRFCYKSQSPINNSSEEITDSINKVCDASKKDDSSVIINDILMASNEFENSTLQTLSFPHSSRSREESSKYDELSNVEPIPFDNVEALEIQTVANDAMELEDVSLMNVQMLQEIEHQNTDIKAIKEPIPSQKEEPFGISRDLRSGFISSNSLNNSSEISNAIKESKSDNTSSSEGEIKSISSHFGNSSKSSNSSALQLVKSDMEQSELAHIPVILQPVKNNSKWSFSSTLATHASTSVDSVIRSLAVDEVPPITREIDITIPPDDETKVPIPNRINNNSRKMHEENLSTLSVDIDGKDVRYVMYFKSSAEKR